MHDSTLANDPNEERPRRLLQKQIHRETAPSIDGHTAGPTGRLCYLTAAGAATVMSMRFRGLQ